MLFDDAPAPVASVRNVRIDPLFWLEMLTLAALTFAIAGLYIMRPPSPGHGRSHALVFDLGAAMSARDGSGTRIEQARQQAMQIIDQAPIGDEFSVIGYALEAQVRHPQTANLVDLRKALGELGSDGGASAHDGSKSRADSRTGSVGDRSLRRSPACACDTGRRRLNLARKFSPGRQWRFEPRDRVARSRHPGLDAGPRRDSQFLRTAPSGGVRDRSRRQRAVPSDH